MQKNKAVGFGVLALSALVMLGQVAFSGPSQQGEQRRGGGRPVMDVGQRVENLSKQLNLTDDQKPKVRAIYEDAANQRQALRQDTSLSRQDRMEKMRAINQSTRKQIENILTAEQKKKWNEIMKENRERRGERQEGQGERQ
jgi:protein CpxP